jgi:hypothetical protein
MDNIQFMKKIGSFEKLIEALGILKSIQIIIPIDNFPDFDFTEYTGNIANTYYFEDKWDFGNDFYAITKSKIDSNVIIPLEKYEEIVSTGNKERNYYYYLSENKMIGEIAINDIDVSNEIDDFRLMTLKLKGIDNSNRTMFYHGSFCGESQDMDSFRIKILSILNLTIIPLEIRTEQFYKMLISESYLLFISNEYKMSLFILFSAFENFIEYNYGNCENHIELRVKINNVYKDKFSDLSKNQIYSTLMSTYNLIEEKRDKIAHGKNEIIEKDEITSAYFALLTLMLSYEYRISAFDKLAIKAITNR